MTWRRPSRALWTRSNAFTVTPCAVPGCHARKRTRGPDDSAWICTRHWQGVDKSLKRRWRKVERLAKARPSEMMHRRAWYWFAILIGDAIEAAHFDSKPRAYAQPPPPCPALPSALHREADTQ